MVEGLDKLADIQALREAAQRPPAEVQQMQMPSPDAGLQSLGQQEVDMATGMPVSFSPADAVSQVATVAGQYAMANPQKTAPFAAALAAFGAGSEAANMIDRRVEAESERENLDAVKNVATSLPDRTRTDMPAMAMPVQAQEEIKISEVAPQPGLTTMMPMKEGGRPSKEQIEKNKNKIENYLISKNYSPNAVAGIMGNIFGENDTFDYKRKQDNGNAIGLFQFDFMKPYYKQYLKDTGKKDSEISQIDFMTEQINNPEKSILGSGNAKKLKNILDTGSVEETTTGFMEIFERPGKPNLNKRIKAAKTFSNTNQAEDENFLDTIKSYGSEGISAVREFLGLREGGDVGEYFEGQVEGKGDGMSDEIPFRVEGGNPDFALLSKDEYVIPADVVSMLGNGSSDAGADELDDFVKDTRKEAFGREKQQTEIDAEKGLSSLS